MSFKVHLRSPIKSLDEFYDRVKEIGDNSIPIIDSTGHNDRNSGLKGKSIHRCFEYGSATEEQADIPNVVEIKTHDFNETSPLEKTNTINIRNIKSGITLKPAQALSIKKIKYGVAYIEYVDDVHITSSVNQFTGEKTTGESKGLKIKRVTVYTDLDETKAKEHIRLTDKRNANQQTMVDLNLVFKKSEIIFEV